MSNTPKSNIVPASLCVTTFKFWMGGGYGWTISNEIPEGRAVLRIPPGVHYASKEEAMKAGEKEAARLHEVSRG